MAGLDFRRGANLFMGTERELAMALRTDVDTVRRGLRSPPDVPDELLRRLGAALLERGQAMTRVGEILMQDTD